MRSSISTGIVAGLIGGVVFGIMMSMMSAPTPDGGSMNMMAMVGMVIKAPTALAGWLYHLFNSAVIGAVFGAVLGGRLGAMSTGLLWGAMYGFIWWILGALILMPVLLGMPAFAPLSMMPAVAMGSLVGHLIFGAVLGVAYVWLTQRGTVTSTTRLGRA
jgi:hypothetical protein